MSTMPPASRLIVCESGSAWAIALRRTLGPTLRVYETRSLEACWSELALSPGSFLAWQWHDDLGGTLIHRLLAVGQRFPAACVAVVADRDAAAFELLVREAGAVHFQCGQRDLRGLAGLIRRHLAENTPPPTSSVRAL